MSEERDSREMDEEQAKVAEKVAKLLSLAAKNSNEAEAAAATAKAQEYLARYNLDLATVEKRAAGGGGSGAGKREDAATAGGQYKYQRDLWSIIARLNFCIYFNTEQRVMRSKTQRLADGTVINRPKFFYQRAHRLVGKVINTTATRNMATYLESTIERLCREEYPQQSQFFSKSAVSFREGMAENLWGRLYDKRQANLRADKERAKKDREEWERRHPGQRIDTALTLATFIDEETDANMDFLNGAGWSAEQARKKAEAKAATAAYWAEQERLQAEYDAAHPEEAAKREKKRLAAAKREAERPYRPRGPGSRGGSGGKVRDEQAFSRGYYKADEIGLDPQAEDASASTRKLA